MSNQLTVGRIAFGPACGAKPDEQYPFGAGGPGYVPVMERNHHPTAQDEMMRMLDECARLGKENAALRQLAIAIEADTTEPKHRREWARQLLTPNVELSGRRGFSRRSARTQG